MCLEFWSLISLRPTNGPWACLEVLAGEWSYYHRWAPGRRSSDTERRASGVDTPGVEREEGDNRLTSQISRMNPDRCRRRSPSHPKIWTHPPAIHASQFSDPIFHGFIVHFKMVETLRTNSLPRGQGKTSAIHTHFTFAFHSATRRRTFVKHFFMFAYSFRFCPKVTQIIVFL